MLPNLDADGKEIQAGDLEARFEEIKKRDEIDEQLGFSRYQEGPTKIGWMVNMHPVRIFHLFNYTSQLLYRNNKVFADFSCFLAIADSSTGRRLAKR